MTTTKSKKETRKEQVHLVRWIVDEEGAYLTADMVDRGIIDDLRGEWKAEIVRDKESINGYTVHVILGDRNHPAYREAIEYIQADLS